jgi:hypothetical protein
METSASSGRTKWLFHRKSIAAIDAIEHVLNVANSYLAYCYYLVVFYDIHRRKGEMIFLFTGLCFIHYVYSDMNKN